MENVIRNIKRGEKLQNILESTMQSLYINGPINTTDLEILCYFKIYRPEMFEEIEHMVIKYMGLHYKELETESLPEIIFGMYQKYIQERFGELFTPVQAKIIEGIESSKCFSFSAPTSTGKSYVFRRIIEQSSKDIVIVVPSRALINEYYMNLKNTLKEKTINLLTFVERINVLHAERNIFILTPERCKDLFKVHNSFDIEFMLFDEAQLGDEESARGLYYDSIIRRSKKVFPSVKYIFAHPFISNPEAQIQKNHFEKRTSKFESFKLKNVGQIYYVQNEDGSYSHFGIEKSVMGKTKVECDYDPIERVLENGGSVLIYSTKTSIVSQSVLDEFSKYTELCDEISDPTPIELIDEISLLIGGNDTNGDDRYSELIHFLKRGIVMHHGSLPLDVRLLIEKFTRLGFCKICFATSTLEQGINMPFDLVFLNTFPASKRLSIKNLIGRAGRSTVDKKFDYGEIVIKTSVMAKFRTIMKGEVSLQTVSLLEKELPEKLSDLEDFKNSILEETYSDEYNLTPNQLENLQNIDSFNLAKAILDIIFVDGNLKPLKELDSRLISEYFQMIYSIFLQRELSKGESAVINSAIQIMIWKIYGKTFKDICFYRYAYISQKQERDRLSKLGTKSAIQSLKKLETKFTMPYSDIPNKSLEAFSLFTKGTKAVGVSYDLIVFDTYDYLDKIISFRLIDIFTAVFDKYYQKIADDRAINMINLIKYGTVDDEEIWLLKYGFTFEEIEWMKPYVLSIDENQIRFNTKVLEDQKDKREIFERFYCED
ncbi:TPA: DEAD/DEAH box helicase [Streptococcus suis]